MVGEPWRSGRGIRSGSVGLSWFAAPAKINAVLLTAAVWQHAEAVEQRQIVPLLWTGFIQEQMPIISNINFIA